MCSYKLKSRTVCYRKTEQGSRQVCSKKAEQSSKYCVPEKKVACSRQCAPEKRNSAQDIEEQSSRKCVSKPGTEHCLK